MCMEKKTTNHYYCYQGRFDAIIELDGEPTLVDWKTASAESIKSVGGENTLENQYGNPIQIVAYISAVNSDPAFENFPKIKRGAIVLTFEDGREAEILRLGEDNIQV
uniref:PD-(D/E)XK endonuclease-like domain-containing protein n=1 Tax=Panagrolaimus sp. JU765 TaxID=591449 RepID=A0AC34RQN6_9BILA